MKTIHLGRVFTYIMASQWNKKKKKKQELDFEQVPGCTFIVHRKQIVKPTYL